MKEDTQSGIKRVNVNVDLIQVFLIINKGEIMINAGVNGKNQLIKVCLIKNLFGIQVVVSVNVINHVMLQSIQTMKIVNVERVQLVNQLNNVPKILMKRKQQE